MALQPGQLYSPTMLFPRTSEPMGWLMVATWCVNNSSNPSVAVVTPVDGSVTDDNVYEVSAVAAVDNYIAAASTGCVTQSFVFNIAQDLPDPIQPDGSVPADSYSPRLKNSGSVPVTVTGQFSYVGVPLAVNPRVPDPLWGGWQ